MSDNKQPSQNKNGRGFAARIAIVALLAAAVAAAFVLKTRNQPASAGETAKQAAEQTRADSPKDSTPPETSKGSLPKLVDLGAGKCIPCKRMAPIIEELKKEYAGRLDVVFIDVWKNEHEGEKYHINLIPTQIFFDASGKERFRHEGFFSKEDILAKWKELGVELPAPAKPAK